MPAEEPVAPHVRPYRPADEEALYDVCVRTADSGADARGLYDTDLLMGDLFAVPYAVLDPDLAFVLDDGGQAVGYVVGTADTARFVSAYREQWIPARAHRYSPLAGPPVTATEHMLALHENPERMVLDPLAEYPAHLHIDLLPAYQRQGHGRRLMAAMLEALAHAGAGGVHVGMLTSNESARAFYDRLGFSVLDVPDPGPLTYLGRATGPLT